MKAPDKIYLNAPGEGDVDYESGQEEIEVATWDTISYSNDDVEYIRKDLLLEWANEELSHAIANIDAYPYEDAFRGQREKIEELIEKLNSL